MNRGLSAQRAICISMLDLHEWQIWCAAGVAPQQQQGQGASGKLPKLPGAVSLLGCLQRFVRPERLGAAEHWVCGGCGRPQHAVKQMSVHRLPPVLCLHVKRFEHTVRPLRLLMRRSCYYILMILSKALCSGCSSKTWLCWTLWYGIVVGSPALLHI